MNLVNLLDEITFWSRQLSEHALFLHLGLDHPGMKAQAFALHRQWEAFRAELGQLTANEGPVARDRAIVLAMDLRALKLEVFNTQKTGTWLGWLFPTFVDHMRRELDYFIGKITGNLTDMNQEACVWMRFMAEHASFAAHLLDPEEVPLIKQAARLTHDFLRIEDGCGKVTLPSLLELGRRSGRELDEYFQRSGIGTAKVRSVIHPVLAEHVVREGTRFVQTLDRMMPRTVG